MALEPGNAARDAQAMGRLGSHPDIIPVFDLGEHEGQPFMVTELMSGGDVEGVMEAASAHRISLEQAIGIARETCRGLELPHSRGDAWDRWHIFWSDERCVPPDHQDSNFRMASQALLDHVPIPPAQIYRMRGEVAPEEAAREYETAVLNVFQTPVPSFDLILLGIGDDGHTASLFPGSEALRENHRLVMANLAPSPPVHRITFTLPLINAARVVAFLDTDGSKAEVLRGVLEPAPQEDVLPAAMVRPTDGAAHWFLTKEAASLLRTTDA